MQIPAGKATPAPPVGTALGPAGVNLQEFCSAFNDATKDKGDTIVPVEIKVYDDRSFTFILKTPPAAFLLKKIAKITKAGAKGANQVVATITKEDLRSVAEIKLPDLNAYDIEDAMKILEGTARNMGIAIKGVNDQELLEQQKEAIAKEAEMAKREQELAEMEASVKEYEENKEVELVEEKDNVEEQKEN